jgi:hypothetical protein
MTEQIRNVYSVCEEYAEPTPPPPARPAAGPAFSLRDKSFNDDIRRETNMMLAMSHAVLRLVIRSLRISNLLPEEFVSTDTLPFNVIRHLHSHLTTQTALKELVVRSVEGTFVSNSGALQKDMLARLKSPDVFLSGRLAKGAAVELTPMERMFGVFSIGNLAVYCATADYVPGQLPILSTLSQAALHLSFGPSGGNLDFPRSLRSKRHWPWRTLMSCTST